MTAWRQGMLAARAELYRLIRSYMAESGVLEVDTPVLGAAANTDPQVAPLSTLVNHPGKPDQQRYYLHTSPEFCMKRLLAKGSGAIYQICKVFRDAELGGWHQPEFSLLEWYRPGYDHRGLMMEIDRLLGRLGLPTASRISYQHCFQRHVELDPHHSTMAELAGRCHRQGFDGHGERRAVLLDFLFSRLVGPHLGRESPVFVYDYPACQAALARIRQDDVPVAERFELFINGMELANGFHELGDADEQLQRFQAENAYRKQAGKPTLPIDDGFISALQDGLPACAGVAIGLDRLLMVLTHSQSINDVLSFPLD